MVSAGVHLLLSSARALAVPVLLYFALGIALLTQARFSVTHAGWQTQGLEIQPGIARRWLFWTVIFLVGVAFVALLLPTQYALGPIQALLGVFGFLFRGIMLLISILFFLLMLLLSFLFPAVEQPQPPALTQDLFAPPGEPPPAAASSLWLEVLLSALFWMLVLAIVGYALYRFLQDRFGTIPEEEGAPGSWWQRLLVWLRALWRQWWAWQHGVQVRLAERRARRREAGEAGARGFRFFFPGRLPPREQVRYFYLSAERRAAQAGKPRAAGQTPYEYQADLDQRFPELEPDLEGLTEAFVGARYSPQPVQREDADAVKPLWQRIKAALRRRRAKSGE